MFRDGGGDITSAELGQETITFNINEQYYSQKIIPF